MLARSVRSKHLTEVRFAVFHLQDKQIIGSTEWSIHFFVQSACPNFKMLLCPMTNTSKIILPRTRGVRGQVELEPNGTYDSSVAC